MRVSTTVTRAGLGRQVNDYLCATVPNYLDGYTWFSTCDQCNPPNTWRNCPTGQVVTYDAPAYVTSFNLCELEAYGLEYNGRFTQKAA
jgi:hypothetical protein